MLNTRLLLLLTAAALFALPAAVMGQPTKGGSTTTTTVPVGGGKGPVTIEGLITRYTTLAGSEANAKSLVNGLRYGTNVELTGTVEVQVQVPVQTQVTETVMVETQVFVPLPPPGHFTTVLVPKTITRTVTTYITETQLQTQTESFMPPTGNMGLGNVDIALAFTEAQLTELDLSKPSPKQLVAALMGGEVEYGSTTPKMKKELPGILRLRANNMGWGQIAAQLGYKLQ